MTRRPEPIQEIDLLAYADGLLEADVARKAEVEHYLSEHADAEEFVAEISAQNDDIREHYGSLLSEPVPEHLTAVLSSEPAHPVRRVLSQVAALVALLLAATTGGWLLGQKSQDAQWQLSDFVERAATFHHAATIEAASPAAGGERMLQPLGWLNQRISLELVAPDLTTDGFNLVAKELLGPEDDPMVRLVYQSGDSTTINLFLRPRWEGAGSGVGKADAEDVAVRYWLDGPLAFAMTIDAATPEADHLARTVREAVGRARLNDGVPTMALSPVSPAPAQQRTDDSQNSLRAPRAVPTPNMQDRPQLQLN